MTTLADELEQLNKHREDLERRIKEEELQEVPNGYLETLEVQDALETSIDDQIIEKVCLKM